MFTRPKRPTHTIDMAPLIDVVFLLLIFFMLTSSFTQPSLPLKLPTASNKEVPPTEPIVISMDRDWQIMINGNAVLEATFGEQLSQLLQNHPTGSVSFRGDRELDYGKFVSLMDQARQAGARQFNIIHEAR